MPRYKLTIEYDGAPFVGWQVQDNGVSVQGVLGSGAGVCGERAVVDGAGRTDAGVHALGQVAHVDLAKDWAPDTVRDALNAHLRPHPVAVLAAERVADDFDARFSARKRHYLYRIVNRRADLALERARLARAAAARCRRHARRRATARRPARFHDLPLHRVPGQIAGQDARPARCGARRRRGAGHRQRALVPAQSGALDGRLAGACGRRQMERRRSCRRACGARPRRLRPVAPPQGLYLVRVDY